MTAPGTRTSTHEDRHAGTRMGKDRRIVLSQSEVTSLLAGRKTQARKVITRLAGRGKIRAFGVSDTVGYDWHFRDKDARWHDVRHARLLELLPHAVGDRLWVQEAWCHTGDGVWSVANTYLALDGKIIFRADDDGRDPGVTWFSPLHLSRQRSRLTLEVTEVRVERLQDISEADAEAEGIEPEPDLLDGKVYYRNYERGVAGSHLIPVASFSSLWSSLHGPDAWAANPWVAAISFRVHRANIDTLPNAPTSAEPAASPVREGGR